MYCRAIAMPFTAWLTEPAPIATICTRCDCRAALAIAPARTFASVADATLSVCVDALVLSSPACSRRACARAMARGAGRGTDEASSA